MEEIKKVSCKPCKSWEEAKPLNWIIVATVSGLSTALLTVLFQKWVGLRLVMQQQLEEQKANLGKYTVIY